MNANELADELENTYPFVGVMEVAATMLRQQQAEIEALKQIIDANNLNQNIGQFVKPTNKPVAWMDYLEHSDVYDLNVSGRGIPLYTHPVKELNDGGEPVKNATYWKRQYNLMASQNDNLKSGLYHANEQIKYLESHPVKEQYKFGVDWSKDGNAVIVLKICEDGASEVVFMDYQEVTHPVKELTDEEILEELLIPKSEWDSYKAHHCLKQIRAILRKAQEK